MKIRVILFIFFFSSTLIADGKILLTWLEVWYNPISTTVPIFLINPHFS